MTITNTVVQTARIAHLIIKLVKLPDGYSYRYSDAKKPGWERDMTASYSSHVFDAQETAERDARTWMRSTYPSVTVSTARLVWHNVS